MTLGDLKKNIGAVSAAVSILIGLSGFTGGYYAFKGTIETSQGYTIERVEKLESKFYHLDDEIQKVRETANATADYAKKSESDRKQVMEKDMPYLRNTLRNINKNLTNLNQSLINIQAEQQRQQIYLQKIFRDNPDLNVPDEN